MIQASIDRRSLRSLAILALLIAVAGGAGKRALAREEPIQSLSLPNVRPEVEPRADLGPDAPPPSYPLEEVNQNVFRGVRHGFVNTTVGNIAFGVLDLKLPGHMPIEFRRVYDSGITAYLPPPPPGQQNEPRWSEDLGPNWALGYAGYLIAIAGGVVQATPEGDVLWWTEQTGGSFTRQFDAPTRHMKLQRSSSTVIVETQMDGTQYTYTWSVSTAGSAYLLTEIKDRSNNKVNLTYTQGYLSHVQNTDGAWIEITRPVYTANYPSTVFPRSRVVKLTDNTGRIVQFDYDSGGRLTRATDVFGKNWTYAYDATSNKLTSATTPLGDVYLTVSYDSQMRVSSYEANAGPWGFAYGAQTTVTDGLNHAWKYTPSSTGITTAVLEPTLGQHTIGLDANHNPTSYTGPMGEHAYWTYDSNHRPLTHTPAGTSSTITYVYDATNGWANTITSVTGGVTTFVRDSAGRVTEERDAYNNKTTATYAVNGDRLTMRLPNGNAANPVSGYLWTLTYDAYGNPITATDPTNRQFQMDYTAQGNLWKLRRPDHQDPVTHQTVYSQWTYNRDMAGRVTTTVDPLGNTWSRTYDDAGRLTRVQGPAGTNLRYVYDARYRLTALWNDAITPNVQLASYTYDAAGQLASQGVAAGGATTYGFDASNRLISVTDPLNRSWLYDRDSSGRVTKVTYPGGRYVTISRDSAGRIISRTYPSDPDNHYRLESYTYDAAGELLTANADEGPDTAHLTWTRDLLERPVSLATVVDYAAIGTGHSLGFTYDPDGNRSTLVEYAPGTTNPQKTYNYTYDTQDRLTQVTADGSTWQASYDSYSGLRTVVQVPAVTGTNTETWSYDAAGGLATHTWNRPDASDTGNETFTLDGEGRLLATANSTAGTSQAMSYRSDGLLSQLVQVDPTTGTTTTGYTYDDGGKLVHSSAATGADPAVITDLQYDLAGRLSQATQGLTGRTYTWSDTPTDASVAFEVWRSPSDGAERSLEIGYGYDGRLRKIQEAHIQEQGVNLAASYLWSALDHDVTLASTEITSDGTNKRTWSMDVGGYYAGDQIPGSQGAPAGAENPVVGADSSARALAAVGGPAMPDAEAPLRVGWSERLTRFVNPLGLTSRGTNLSAARTVLGATTDLEAQKRPRVTLPGFTGAIVPVRIDFVDDWANEGIARRQWKSFAQDRRAVPGDASKLDSHGASSTPFTSDCNTAACLDSTQHPSDSELRCADQFIRTFEVQSWRLPFVCQDLWWRLGHPPLYGSPSGCGYEFPIERSYDGQSTDVRGPDVSEGGVSLAHGEYVLSEMDLAAFDRFGTMPFTRTYRSKVTGVGALGYRWRHNWEHSIEYGHDKKHGDQVCGTVVRWVKPDGDFLDFHYDFGATTPSDPAGTFYRIRKYHDTGVGADMYEIRAISGETYKFYASSGTLYSTSHAGFTTTFTWSATGDLYALSAISSPDGQRFALSYFNNKTTDGVKYGRLREVDKTGSDSGDKVTYDYNSCGELSTITRESEQLGYDKQGNTYSTAQPRTETYTYTGDKCTSDGFNSHLLTTLAVGQMNPLAGDSAPTPQTLVVNHYGQSYQGASIPAYEKVIGQCFGKVDLNCAVGAEDLRYGYTDVELSSGLPRSSTTVTDARISPPVAVRHDILDGKLQTLTEDVGGLNRVTQYSFANGVLTKTTRADGTCHIQVYVTVAGISRVQQDIEETATSCGGTDHSTDRITYYTYEPVSGRVRSVTRPEAFLGGGQTPSSFTPSPSDSFSTIFYYDLDQAPAGISGLQDECTTWSITCPTAMGELNDVDWDNQDWDGNLVQKLQNVPADGQQPASTLVWKYVSQPGGRPLLATEPDGVRRVWEYYTAASNSSNSSWDYRNGSAQCTTNLTASPWTTTCRTAPGPLADSQDYPKSGQTLQPLVTKYAWSNRGMPVSVQDPALVRHETLPAVTGLSLREITCHPGSITGDCDPAVSSHNVLNQVRHTYDLRGREIQTLVNDVQASSSPTAPPQLSAWMAYDTLGNVTARVRDFSPSASYPSTTTDANHIQAVEQNCYDGRNRVIYSVSPERRVTGVTYDALDRVLSVKKYNTREAVGASPCTDIGGNGSTYVEVQSKYDAVDRLYATRDPNQSAVPQDAGKWTYHWYEPFGAPEFVSDGKPSGATDPILFGGEQVFQTPGAWYSQNVYTSVGLLRKTLLYGRSATLDATNTVNVDAGFLRASWYDYDAVRRPRKVSTVVSVQVPNKRFVPQGSALGSDPPTSAAVTEKRYGVDGTLSSVLDPALREVTLSYDGLGRRNITTLPAVNGHQDQTVVVFDTAGRPFHTEATTYDPNGVSHVVVAEKQFDLWGRVSRQTGAPSGTTNAEDLITTFEYDGLSRVVRAGRRWNVASSYTGYDPNDRVTMRVYDRLGRVTETGESILPVPTNPPADDPTLAWTKYTYDNDGLVRTLTDAESQTTTWDYTNLPDAEGENGLGRLRSMTYPGGAQGVVVKKYDANGNATEVHFRKNVTSAASAIIWTQSYDDKNRMIQRQAAINTVTGDPAFPGSTSQDFTYDEVGRIVAARDRSPSFGADQDIWVEARFDPGGRNIQELQRMTLNGGTSIDRYVKSAYAADGFRTSLTYPTAYSGGTALADYTVTMARDSLGRLSTITGPLSSFEPAVGQGRPTGSLATYSWVGAQVWERVSGNGLDQRYFDGTGTSLYDSLGRIRGVRALDPSGSAVTDFRYGYDRVGNRTYEQRRHEPTNQASTLFRTRTYKTDLMSRLTGWKEKALGSNPSNPTIPNGPIIDPYDPDPTDDLGSDGTPDGSPNPIDGEGWTLDHVGNWVDQTIGVTQPPNPPMPPTRSFTANTFNQYATIDPDAGGAAPAVAIDHDWLGQMWVDRDAQRVSNWDAFGRLTKVYQGTDPDTSHDALVATYRYDAFNRRVERNVVLNGTGDPVTRFIYDGWRAMEERGVTGVSPSQSEAVRARYGFGIALDELVWMDRDMSAPADPTPNGSIDSRFYVSQDALGSVTAATIQPTDATGTPNGPFQVAEHYTYSSYGSARVWTGAWTWQTPGYSGGYQNASTIGLPYLYTGQRLDAESGLYYFKNRQYDPRNGTFLRRDPLGYVPGPSLYEYGKSLPSSLTDPYGLQSDEARRQSDPGGAYTKRAGDVLRPLTDQDYAASGVSGLDYGYRGFSGYAASLAKRAADDELSDDEARQLERLVNLGGVPAFDLIGSRVTTRVVPYEQPRESSYTETFHEANGEWVSDGESAAEPLPPGLNSLDLPSTDPSQSMSSTERWYWFLMDWRSIGLGTGLLGKSFNPSCECIFKKAPESTTFFSAQPNVNPESPLRASPYADMRGDPNWAFVQVPLLSDDNPEARDACPCDSVGRLFLPVALPPVPPDPVPPPTPTDASAPGPTGGR